MIYKGYLEVRYGREAAHAEEMLESTDEKFGTGAETDVTEEAPVSE